MRYESEQDVKTRLGNSVVMHNGRPVYVIGTESKEVVIVQDLETEKHSKVKVAALDLDPSHAPLGYVTDDYGDVYVAMRKPARRYKQGLTGENLVLKSVLKDDGARRRMIHFASKNIGRTMLGKFEDVGDAFQKTRSGEVKVSPFHRDWAVGVDEGELALLFRGNVVGFVLDTSVKLLPECFYLKESLEVALG